MTKLPFETDLSASVAVVTGGAGVICSSFAKVIAKAGSNGRLFGAVTNKEISDALSKQHGTTVPSQSTPT